MDHVTEMVPVDISHAWVFGIVEFADVYGAEIARSVSVEELFAARVAGIDWAH
jgi:hypothetical protein